MRGAAAHAHQDDAAAAEQRRGLLQSREQLRGTRCRRPRRRTSFYIYEDGQLVSEYESKQTILNPEVAAVHFTLLLVDMSGSVSESGNGPLIAQAVVAFADRVGRAQKVGIYAFDGGPDLYPIVPFTDQAGSAQAGVAQLATFKPKDPSTNLNGAIVKALDELDNSLGRATQPLKFGTLVVFTDGTDRANRIPGEEMRRHIRDKPFDVFAIGLGAEIQDAQLKEIGKSGTAMAADKTAIVKAFDDVGGKVEGRTKSYYLLSYCSPARAGQHEVRIEAVFKGGDGKREETGSLKRDFDATGFAPGCDPNSSRRHSTSRRAKHSLLLHRPLNRTRSQRKKKRRRRRRRRRRKKRKRRRRRAGLRPDRRPPGRRLLLRPHRRLRRPRLQRSHRRTSTRSCARPPRPRVQDGGRDRVGRRLGKQDPVAVVACRQEEARQRRGSDKRAAALHVGTEVAPSARELRRRERRDTCERGRQDPGHPCGGHLPAEAGVLHRRTAEHAPVPARDHT